MSRRRQRARALWRWVGEERPPFAVIPGEGQESVWDYPRPPVVEPIAEPVTVHAAGVLVAHTREAVRVLETASPPTVYLPREAVEASLLRDCPGQSSCEWKGTARYWSIEALGRLFEAVGWSYEEPFPEYEILRSRLSFYPGRVECHLGDERVKPQPGRFYGGWVTSSLVGPIKGEPGSEGW